MKISIIGASGFIGSHLHDYLTENLSSGFRTVGTYYSNPRRDLTFLDITEKDQIEKYLLVSKPDYIIMLAGSKNVKKCEKNYSFAFRMNSKPVEDILDIIRRHKLNIKMIFFSSDYVFNGMDGLYTRHDVPHPTTNYGKTKLISEIMLDNISTDNLVDYKIVRTGAVMGHGAVFFEWLVSSLKGNNEISLFDNVYYSPTPVILLSEIICEMILNYDNIPQKIIHVVGEQRLSRYEFGLIIQDLMNKTGLIIPENADIKKMTFQEDLSLIQSDFVKKHQSKTLLEYLEMELGND